MRWAVVVHTFNPSTWEAEAGRFLNSRPAGLQSEFQDSKSYTEKPPVRVAHSKKINNSWTKSVMPGSLERCNQ